MQSTKSTKTMFVTMNKGMTFVKPELGLFLTEEMGVNTLEFISVIDVEKKLNIGDSTEPVYDTKYDMKKFLSEDVFGNYPYNIVECTSSQYSTVSGAAIDSNVPVELYIIHHDVSDSDVKISSKAASKYVVIGDFEKVVVSDDEPVDVFTLCDTSVLDECAEKGIIVTRTDGSTTGITHRSNAEVAHSEEDRESLSKDKVYIVTEELDDSMLDDAVIVKSFGDNTGKKTKYTVMKGSNPYSSNKPMYVSIDFSGENKLIVSSTDKRSMNQEERDSYNNDVIKIQSMTDDEIGEHIARIRENIARRRAGQGSVAAQKKIVDEMTVSDLGKEVTSRFDKMVLSLTDNEKYFIVAHGQFLVGSTNGIIAPADYFGNLTVFFPDMPQSQVEENARFSNRTRILIGNDVTDTKGLPLVAKKYINEGMTIGQAMFPILRERTRFIDDFTEIAFVKRPSGRFSLMYKKMGISTKVESLKVSNETAETIKEIEKISLTKPLLQVYKRKVFVEYMRAANKRPQPLTPYPAVPVVRNETIEQAHELDEQQKEKMIEVDLLKDERKHFRISDNTLGLVKDQRYAIISGNNYNCVVCDCDIVVLTGTGEVFIHGYVHTLISDAGIRVNMTNVGKSRFSSDVYLYIQDGTIYDELPRYPDDIKITNKVFEIRDNEVTEEAPNAENEETLGKSIVRRFVYKEIPVDNNYKLSAIMRTEVLN